MHIQQPAYFGASWQVRNGTTNPDLMGLHAHHLRGIAQIAQHRDEITEAVHQIEDRNDRMSIHVSPQHRNSDTDFFAFIDTQHNGRREFTKPGKEGYVAFVKRVVREAKKWAPDLKTITQAEAPELHAMGQYLTTLLGPVIGDQYEVFQKQGRTSVVIKVDNEYFFIYKDIRRNDRDDASQDHVMYSIQRMNPPEGDSPPYPSSMGHSSWGWADSMGIHEKDGQLEIYSFITEDKTSEMRFLKPDEVMRRSARDDASKRILTAQNAMAAEIINKLTADGHLG